jgi:hypothetical protein
MLLLVTLAVGAVIALVAIVGVLVAGVATPAAPPPPPTPATPPERAPRGAKPMVVTEMATRGFFAVEDASGRREEPLPDSPLGSGEFPMGLWVAPDHTVFVVGKLYTGKPGPDDGAVWRRGRDGTWSLSLRLPGRVIGHVSGRSESEVVVGLMGGIATWDGAGWTEHALPYAMMWKVWLEPVAVGPDGELVAQAFDGSAAYVVGRGVTTMTTPRTEPRTDRYAFVRDGITYRIFDRSTPLGERALAPHEEAQIKRELAQVQAALARGEGRVPPRDSGIVGPPRS